jgi:hypothetical protein
MPCRYAIDGHEVRSWSRKSQTFTNIADQASRRT